MSDYGIKSEWREAWNRERIEDEQDPYFNLRYPWQGKLLADLSVHLLAELMRERFEREHSLLDGVWCGVCSYGDVHKAAPPDQRHKYTYDDWCAEARKELSNGNEE